MFFLEGFVKVWDVCVWLPGMHKIFIVHTVDYIYIIYIYMFVITVCRFDFVYLHSHMYP